MEACSVSVGDQVEGVGIGESEATEVMLLVPRGSMTQSMEVRTRF